MRTVEAAQGKWKGVLVALGVDQKFLKNKHGPCPICAGTDRFRFDDKNGTGTYYCSGCGAGDGMALAMKATGKSFKETAQEIDKIVGTVSAEKVTDIKRDPAIALRKLMAGAVDPKGTPVEKYLASRGLSLPEAAVKYNPKVAYYEGGKFVKNYPAMLAIFANQNGAPNSLHITYLTPEGTKAKVDTVRKIMTPKEPLAGGAIRLFKQSNVMGVAEGIETALAASQMDDLPVWACANANMLERWNPPEGVEWVHIYADNDKNYTGQAVAYKLANRLSLAGVRVLVCVPEIFGDWNDVLLRGPESQAVING